MRKRVSSGGPTVQVIAGNHAVFLGFDLIATARKGCLGFALHREDHTENEAYWIAGFKAFRSVVPAPDPKVMYTTDKHPVQSMWWGDYSAKPAHDYTYKIVPLYGSPEKLTSKDAVTVSVDVTTNDPATGTHGIYFNRGVAASQAYAVKFGAKPAKLTPEKRAEAMVWLSRGLQEAMCAFITDGASSKLAIRAAVYEFTESTVLEAFAAARAAGADVRIVYHATGKQGDSNEQAIVAAKLDRAMLIPRTHAPIAHNKFIVRADRAADGTLSAQQVWTGSTNLSQGGIFGHSNVGHIVRDAPTAGDYLAFWDVLETNPEKVMVKAWVSANSSFTAAALESAGIRTQFSPRQELDPLDWYAERYTLPSTPTYLTLPFGMDNKHFEPAVTGLPADDKTVRFAMLNKMDDHQAVWSANHALQVAVGSSGGPDTLARWAKEELTGFNPMVKYLHTKILLVDALGAAPTTISGSANFSEASTTSNDENMLIVTGDRGVADVYLTEYTRIFQHFYARWWAANLNPHGSDTHSFLAEDETWQEPYWNLRSPKNAERQLYANQVVNET